MKNLGIIGLGLIGGSMAIDLKRKGFAKEILGVDADPVNAAAAQKISLVDSLVSFEECVDQSDVIILAVPVDAALKLLPAILDRFEQTGAKDKLVMDVCSTKEHLSRSVNITLKERCMWHLTRCPVQNIAVHGRRFQDFLTVVQVSSVIRMSLTAER